MLVRDPEMPPSRSTHRTTRTRPSDWNHVALAVWFAGGSERAIADFVLHTAFDDAWSECERADHVLLLAAARGIEPTALARVGAAWLDLAIARFGTEVGPVALDLLHDTVGVILATAGRIQRATAHVLIERIGHEQAGRINVVTRALLMAACAVLEIAIKSVPFLAGPACEVLGRNFTAAAERIRGLDVAAFELELVAIAMAQIEAPISRVDESDEAA